MQTNHTPGPWVVGTYLNKQSVLDEYSGVIAAQIPEDADARLIAAAPDLLAALQAIVCHEQAMQPYRLEQARAAITRAIGA